METAKAISEIIPVIGYAGTVDGVPLFNRDTLIVQLLLCPICDHRWSKETKRDKTKQKKTKELIHW